MEAADFRHEATANAPFRDALHRYTHAFFGMLAQASACNRTHEAPQRLAFWLLMAHDRVGTDTFPMTQELMAQMLGSRRATVNESAGHLRGRGAFAFHHGILRVRNRAALVSAACEGYGVIRGEYDRLLDGPDTSS